MTTGLTRGLLAAAALGPIAGPAAGFDPGLPTLPPVAAWEAKAAPVQPARGSAPAATAGQLRTRAVAAEATGDWEAAFAAYHDLYRLDRSGPGVRDRLYAALRRVQQVRRHRDPAYGQYVGGLSVSEAVGLFGEVAAKVPGVHADPARSTPQQLWANGVEELTRAVDDPVFRRAVLGDPSATAAAAYRSELLTEWALRSIPDAREARSALKQLVAATLDHFPQARAAAVAVEFVCGACAGLDEYTAFVPPAAAPAADWASYGLTVDEADGALEVEAVVPLSWADLHTRLRPGDRITRVNGRPADYPDVLRNPVNGVHEVEWVPADGGLTAAARLPAVVPSVYGGRLVESMAGIAYLRVGEFREGTPRELAEEVAALHGARVLVLDLRRNSGGSFLAAVEVARRLLPGGEVVGTQGQLPGVAGQVFMAAGPAAIDLPLVALIDGETASAAEVVAAALKGNGRAVLVGSPTFGKGAIQYPLRLGADDEKGRAAVVRLTIARLLGPRGVPFDGVGVTPHVPVQDPTGQWDAAVREATARARPVAVPMPMMPPADGMATVAP